VGWFQPEKSPVCPCRPTLKKKQRAAGREKLHFSPHRASRCLLWFTVIRHDAAKYYTFGISFSSFSCLLFHLQNEKGHFKEKKTFSTSKRADCAACLGALYPWTVHQPLSLLFSASILGGKQPFRVHSYCCCPTVRDGDISGGSIPSAHPSPRSSPGRCIPPDKL